MITLEINLPDKLAHEAINEGLFEPKVLEAMIRNNLKKNAIDDLFVMADKFNQSNTTSMTLEEIQKEVNKVRSLRKNNESGT